MVIKLKFLITKFKISLFLLIIFKFLTTTISSQDATFTQFYANPLYLNPAFAGTHLAPRATFNYRNQWPGIPGTFVTSAFSYDQQVNSLHGGVGIMFVNDQMASSLQSNRISAIYSYQIKLSRKFSLRAGFESTFWQKKLNYNELTFGDMIDPIRGFVYQTGDVFTENGTRSGMDFSTGLLGFSEKFYIGFAAHHLTQPDESLLTNNKSLLQMKYTGHFGFHLPLNLNSSIVSEEESTISPNVLYRRQGDFEQINLGLYIQKGPYVGGLWYRNNDAIIVLFGYELGLVKIGYSYDVTISSLSMATSGSHEISLQINFQSKTKKKTSTISCPSF
jgi:type IX secretion system PorP/SprF family membrane protein